MAEIFFMGLDRGRPGGDHSAKSVWQWDSGQWRLIGHKIIRQEVDTDAPVIDFVKRADGTWST